MMRFWRVVTVASILMSSACSRPPKKPHLRLTLSLSKTEWHAGEYLWYRLEVASDGGGTAPIYDRFWLHQDFQGENWEQEHGTYLEITDSKGNQIFLGRHGDAPVSMWGNDLSGYRDPKREGFSGFAYGLLDHGVVPPAIWWTVFGRVGRKWKKGVQEPVLLLHGGEHFVATPSRVVPLQEQPASYQHNSQNEDPRVLPQVPPGLTEEQLRDLRARWESEVERAFLYGRPDLKTDTMVAPPAGFRILDGYDFKPGHYRVRAVLNERAKLPARSAEEAVRNWKESHDPSYKGPSWGDFFAKKVRDEWKGKSADQIKEISESRRKIEEDNEREPYAESNVLEFEVLP